MAIRTDVPQSAVTQSLEYRKFADHVDTFGGKPILEPHPMPTYIPLTRNKGAA